MNNLTKICLTALSLTCCYHAEAQTEATYYTSMGSFKVLLTDGLTPRTVDSFIARVSEKFYDGLTFHRVIDNFMIQGGDPAGDGTGGPGYSFPDEFDPTLKNVPGALAMANSGPNTNGCQFFINLVTNSHLNNVHTVFGKVTTNFTVVQSIGHVATNASNKPLTNVMIDSIRITQFPAAVSSTGANVTVTAAPNPCRGIFTISLPAIATKVTVLNMHGQAVYNTQAKGTLKIDLTSQPPGLYIISAENADGKAESRLIVQ